MLESLRKETFHRWVKEYSGILYKVVRAHAQDHHDQEDLFQEALTQIWRAIPRFERNSKESTFMYRVALFTAIRWKQNERRRRDREQRVGEHEELRMSSLEQTSNPRLDWLYERISELDELDRALVLLMLDGLSYREIGEVLGISESNVGAKLTRVRKKLTEILRKEEKHGI